MKVVFDTNIFVSAFIIPGSRGQEAFLLAHRRKISLYSSVPMLTETARILRTTFSQSETDVMVSLKLVSRAAMMVRPTRKVTVLQDMPDNHILECAVTAQADLIVTGDRELLALREFEGISIVRLADLLRMVPSE